MPSHHRDVSRLLHLTFSDRLLLENFLPCLSQGLVVPDLGAIEGEVTTAPLPL